ncbi:UPF0758 domain-containing protein [Streptococcus suis]
MYQFEFKEEEILPRELLVEVGADLLSFKELLAFFIRNGTKKEPVNIQNNK